MKTSLLTSVAAATFLLMSAQANAADLAVPAEDNSLGLYVSLFGGASFPESIDTFADRVSVLQTYDSTLDLKTGYLFGGAIGMHVTDVIRGEVELSHSSWKGNDASWIDGAAVTGSDGVSGKISATYLLANLWLDWKNNSAFTPYVGGGAGAAWVNGSIDYDSSAWGHGDGRGTNFAFQLGGGLKFDLTENASVDLGYRYKSILNVDFKNRGAGEPNLENGDVNSHNVQLGLTYSF